MAYKYKNETANKLTIMGVGEVEAGATIECEQQIENPNLTLVGGQSETAISPTPQPQPTIVDTSIAINQPTEEVVNNA